MFYNCSTLQFLNCFIKNFFHAIEFFLLNSVVQVRSVSNENTSISINLRILFEVRFLDMIRSGGLWAVRRVSKSAPSTISLYTLQLTHNTGFIRFSWRIGNSETRKRYVTETWEGKSWNVRRYVLRNAKWVLSENKNDIWNSFSSRY